MTKIEAARIRQELCAIFDTALASGVETISFLMSSLTVHDLNVRFGAAKEKLKKLKPDFNFDFSEKVYGSMKEKIYGEKRVGKKPYSLYEVVYGLVLLLDCFLQLDELESSGADRQAIGGRDDQD